GGEGHQKAVCQPNGRSPRPTKPPDPGPFDFLAPHEPLSVFPGPRAGLSLSLRYLPRAREPSRGDRVALYVHGGTFPSGLSIAHRFDGRSWRDELCDAGFHVWALDFHGFGRLSDPYPEMASPADGMPPLGRPQEARRQIEAAI